jgi:DNA-binding transcriptional ArsR family regulator
MGIFALSSEKDPEYRRLVYFLLAATRGGMNRIQILKHLRDEPANANRLATDLKLDYKTVVHHIKVLEQHGLIVSSNKGEYGNVYFLSPYFESRYSILEEIWAKVDKAKTQKG